MNETADIFRHRTFQHLIRHQETYLPLIAAALLLISYGIRLVNGHPLLMGAESYFYLLSYAFLQYLPLWLLALLSAAMGTASVWLLLRCCKSTFHMNALSSPLFSFTYGILVIASPVFLWTFSTLSGFSVLVFSMLLGWYCLLQKRRGFHIVALLLFTPVAFIDLYSVLLLLCFMIFLYFSSSSKRAEEPIAPIIPWQQIRKKPYRTQPYFVAALYAALLFIAGIFLHKPFIAGPFAGENILLDMLADVGGAPGASVFLLLLGIIGISIAWKKKEFYAWYIFLAVTLAAYLYRPLAFFPLMLFLSLFAAQSVIKLFRRPWTLPLVKNITFLLLCLGLLFSTLSYLDRVAELPPTKWDHAAMVFMEKKTPSGSAGSVLAEPEQAYYIKYLASGEPFYQPHTRDKERQQLLREMYNATYITGLFPPLEQQNISIVYVTPSLKESLPAEYGFLFLLQNERFKLLWEKGDYQVWVFRQE